MTIATCFQTTTNSSTVLEIINNRTLSPYLSLSASLSHSILLGCFSSIASLVQSSWCRLGFDFLSATIVLVMERNLGQSKLDSLATTLIFFRFSNWCLLFLNNYWKWRKTARSGKWSFYQSSTLYHKMIISFNLNSIKFGTVVVRWFRYHLEFFQIFKLLFTIFK